MNIVIVTNSYKRSCDLVERSLLASLKQMTSKYKLIFIDQNEKMLKLSNEILNHSSFSHLHIVVNCVSVARNSFDIPLEADWLIFCDDDGFLKDDYLVTLEKLIKENPSTKVFAGSIIRDDNDEFYTPRHKVGGDLNLFRNTKLLMGSNFAIDASVFKKLNGFDERFGAGSYWGSGEETDFAWKAHFEGIPMEYRKELVVYHVKPFAGSYTHSINKAFRYGVGKGALVAKWLIQRKKMAVLYEVGEMILIPFIQSFRDILLLKPQNIAFYLSALIGRIFGFFKFLLVRS